MTNESLEHRLRKAASKTVEPHAPHLMHDTIIYCYTREHRELLTEAAAALESTPAQVEVELPTPSGPWHATSDDEGYYTYTAAQLIAYGHACASARTAPAEGELLGWIVTNGQGNRFRAWANTGPTWTDDRMAAVRFARREDAEAVFAEDEDAWGIVQVYDTARPAKAEGGAR